MNLLFKRRKKEKEKVRKIGIFGGEFMVKKDYWAHARKAAAFFLIIIIK